jgi:1-phosphatidylinositol-3-phosphate 5-kinase
MDGTTMRASVLAKLMGFYTVEMANLVSGDKDVVHLLVIENLFFEHHVVKTFDLKGIQGRKVKANAVPGEVTRTLFDMEWVEGT